MDILDIAVRLGAATLVGVLLGLNRDLHGKSTGVRTLGLVCLGSALAEMRARRPRNLSRHQKFFCKNVFHTKAAPLYGQNHF